MHYIADRLIMCLHPLGPNPTPPPPPHHAIDLAFNAQTNSSLVIPGYFLGPLLSQHNPLKGGGGKQCEMSWGKNFICSINLESGSFLSNETVDELFASGL